MSDQKLMGCHEAPYLCGMACERILQAQRTNPKSHKSVRTTAISHTRIEYEVDIFQVALGLSLGLLLIMPIPPKLTIRSCLPRPVVSTSQNATDAGR